MFLFKIQFFHSVLSDTSKEKLDAFYKEHIYSLIVGNPRLNSIQNTLFGIAMNPAIVRSRTYQQSWEECCHLFEIGIEKAINEIYYAHQKSAVWQHSCKSKVKCDKCLDILFYNENCWKMDTIEEDILSRYTTSRKKSFEYASSSEDDRKVNNYDLFMNKINKQIARYDNMNNDNTSSTPFEANNFVLMELDDNENDNPNEQKVFYDDNFYYPSYNSLKDNMLGIKEEIESHHTPITFYTSDSKFKSINSITTQSQIDNKKNKMKDFQFKFSKRENIDKKILRKFRKYLRDGYKKNLSDIMPIILQSTFWYHFIQDNILPPFNYPLEKKEFKSFNGGFMHWIFEHDSAYELYSLFLHEFSLNLINHFLLKYSLSPLDEEFSHLKQYITSLATIYGASVNGNDSTISDNTEYLFEVNPIKPEVDNEERLIDNMNMNIYVNSKSNLINSKSETYNGYGCNTMHPQSADIFNELIKTKQR